MILCVTLNPSWDITHVCRGWQASGVVLVRAEQSFAYAGGKGVNVARGLRDLGQTVRNLGFANGFVVRPDQEEGELAHVLSMWIEIAGRTRTNLTLLDPETGCEIHSVCSGPEIQLHEWLRLRRSYEASLDHCELVVLAGSLPGGLPLTTYQELAAAAHEGGVRTLLDASGQPLRLGVEAKPWAIKPNREELAELVGRPLPDLPATVAAARELLARGIQLVAVTLGSEGAIVVTDREAWHATAPPVQVVNTVGCGDSFVAGLIHAAQSGLPLPDQLRGAVAAGTANVTVQSPGSVPAVVHELHKQVEVRRIA